MDAPSTSQIPPSKKLKLDFGQQASVSFSNPPVLTNIYVDPDTKENKCVVAMPFFPGVKEVELDIVDEMDGQVLKVTHNWPSSMFNTKEMFRKPKGQTLFPSIHPIVLTLENALKNVRANKDDVSSGIISVKLPTHVNPEPKTWEKTFNKMENGSVVLFLILVCTENDYAMSKNEKTVKFE